ncbi:hypothetical protein Q8A67_017939 [Cirrhinus molitorella]|uniref:Uncharacterized protein n=1 Tax=Cirrhinus molitorella TaxID=172907 RepID=A0AA88TG51_9TELE|nr:hypothetical protein Q8A67_017939 [Cirrhinus molitorella]
MDSDLMGCEHWEWDWTEQINFPRLTKFSNWGNNYMRLMFIHELLKARHDLNWSAVRASHFRDSIVVCVQRGSSGRLCTCGKAARRLNSTPASLQPNGHELQTHTGDNQAAFHALVPLVQLSGASLNTQVRHA